MKHRLLAAAAFATMVGMGATTVAYAADPQIWISDSAGDIGLVNVNTGAVSNVNNTGHVLTDIGFIGTQLYGTDFTNLYSVSTATGAATLVGTLPGGGGGMNALVGSGGSLLGASNQDTNLYSINPTNAATTVIKTGLPGASAGDLAFAGGTLYASEIDPANGNDMLVNVTTKTTIGDFTAGGNPLGAVFGLAYTGGTMYAVDGTEVYSVNLATAALTGLSNYSGHGLVDAFGAAVVSENTAPGPHMGEGLLGFAAMTALLIGARYRGLFV
jgi:hypothetical protein